MRSLTADRDSRLLRWLRVREFAVPPSMIESATARRAVGDWAGACAVARVDVDLDLRAVQRARGSQFAGQLRADLRHLAPDLLRWHLPRIAPDGLLRPGLTIPLARYPVGPDADGTVHLVARTPPAWAAAGQRISLALWDGSLCPATVRGHPHPRPDRRFRLDLHRHLWDARRVGELPARCGAQQWPPPEDPAAGLDPVLPRHSGCAVHRWAAEAAILLHADRRAGGTVAVRLAGRQALLLDLDAERDPPGPLRLAPVSVRHLGPHWPVLPDAATWVPPDLELLRAGLIDADRLHPLVATALVPGHRPAGAARTPDSAGSPRPVECRGARHRVGLVDGVLAALDHDPAEIRRETLLAALGGTPLPCLQWIDAAHRHPEDLVEVRARLDHGDTAGALAAVEGLLGPGALLGSGALRDELETAALRRVSHGLFRTGLGLVPVAPDSRSRVQARPRHATAR